MDYVNNKYLYLKKYKYVCNNCNYKSNKKSSWNKHIKTSKHIRFKNVNIDIDMNNNKYYICNLCYKKYKQRSGLWKHKQKCSKLVLIEEKHDLKQENIQLKSMMYDIIYNINKDNEIKKEMFNQIKEQHNIIKNIIPRIGNTNQVNINVFLNEQCRDAINMSEFIDSLKFNIDDINLNHNNNLLNGLSTLFISNLKQLDTFKRPIHCTDFKKEILYIKDNNEWDKNNSKEKIKKAIYILAKKQEITITEWQKKNPNWSTSEIGVDKYIKYVNYITSDYSKEKNQDKFVKIIAKETILNKL